MPELYELWAALLVLLKWFYSVKDDPKVSKLLQSLWADPTGSEQKNSKKSSLAGQGHIYSLNRSSKIKRGPKAHKHLFGHHIFQLQSRMQNWNFRIFITILGT
jgi:hypothetical protein